MARSRGRAGSASGPIPAAIAPEDTKTTSRPFTPSGVRQRASTSTSASMRAASIAPPGVVSEEDPALTPTRRAPVMAVRISPAALGSSAVEPPVGAAPAHALLAAGEHLRLPVEHDRLSLGPDEQGRAGPGPRLGQPGLDTEPGEPVGQIA